MDGTSLQSPGEEAQPAGQVGVNINIINIINIINMIYMINIMNLSSSLIVEPSEPRPTAGVRPFCLKLSPQQHNSNCNIIKINTIIRKEWKIIRGVCLTSLPQNDNVFKSQLRAKLGYYTRDI